MSAVMAYGLVVHALWYAPIYAWLLLVSGWARRLPILWAALPPLLLQIFQSMAGVGGRASFVRYRLIGALTEAFQFEKHGDDPIPLPLRFLGSMGLWTGLVLAACFLVLAVRQRRRREPL
jgi:ABC-2 type transport system permease protein